MTGTLMLRESRTERIHHTIQLWITTKTGISESLRTREAYENAIISFRSMTLAAGLDLDGFAPDLSLEHLTVEEREQSLAALGLLAQSWAASAQKDKQLQQGISAATYNNRLTIIISFYRFAKEQRLFMQKAQKTYTSELKREAVRLAHTSGKPITHIARE